MLFTRCPNCETTFRITADTLRVAHGTVRCGNCATVYSAFSGLRQDTLDPGMQADEEYLSPTLQTQELASIEDIDSPALDDSPSASDATAEPAARRGDVAAAAQQPPAPSGAEKPAAPAGAPSSDAVTPAQDDEPVERAPANEAADEPITASAADDSETAATSERNAATAPHEPPAGETSGALQFEVPVDDEWSQLLREIEESSSAREQTAAGSGDESPDHRDDADEPTAAGIDDDDDHQDFFDIGEPDSLEQWGAAGSGRRDRQSSRASPTARDRTAAEAIAVDTRLDADADEEPSSDQAPISAAEIDATLSAEPDPDVMTALELGLEPRRADDTHGRRWLVGAALMSLLLVGQLVHHNRTLLAAQPVVGTLVQRAYTLLGATLAPRWDLDQYEITNWAATAGETDSGVGNLRITAQIRNGGPTPQPYPSLELELKDRWEAVIGRRVFSPREYLGAAVDTDMLMASGQTVPAELTVVDPGLDASGFELDVCLESGNSSYRCAADRVFDQ